MVVAGVLTCAGYVSSNTLAFTKTHFNHHENKGSTFLWNVRTHMIINEAICTANIWELLHFTSAFAFLNYTPSLADLYILSSVKTQIIMFQGASSFTVKTILPARLLHRYVSKHMICTCKCMGHPSSQLFLCASGYVRR
jgi:hypothetical protein